MPFRHRHHRYASSARPWVYGGCVLLLLLAYTGRESLGTSVYGGAVAGGKGGVSGAAVPPLDVAMVTDPSGWSLRIEGNGSAQLAHDQYPGHRLYYPPATFSLRPATRARAQCASGRTQITPCTELRYYDSRRNRTEQTCSCLANPWASERMEWALRHMALADDADPAGRRARRLLERQWLVAGR